MIAEKIHLTPRIRGCILLSVKYEHRVSTQRPAGRAAPGIPGDACSRRRREQACHDGNLKCSAIWGIVRLHKHKTIPMTEQDKANIFDVVIKPFLCPDSNHESQGS